MLQVKYKQHKISQSQVPGGAASESLPSELGAAVIVRIFVGTRAALAEAFGLSGNAEPARDDGPVDAAVCAFRALDLLEPLPAGPAERDAPEIFIAPVEEVFSVSAFAAVAEAHSESFSPAHVLANHLPPAMPRISRREMCQRRTL